ncbi:Gfo/Idh/MocA family protein [Bacteroidota bacterium]
MLKIGVMGAGHLGKIHINCIKEIKDYQLIGFFDPNEEVASQVAKEYKADRFETMDDLIEAVDIVDIVTPTISHFECAYKSLKKFKHVFIEKPVVTTPTEAKKLIDIAAEARVKVQVGHVERFNPAFMAVEQHLFQPMFIESHRLAQFNPRGTDVPVILDLMIHDIDIILSVVKSNIKKISASGVAVISDTPDIANARIEFDNGCVANLTASRISMKNMRKTRFFQKDAYVSIDFLDKKAEIIRMKNILNNQTTNPLDIIIDLGNNKGKKQIIIDKPKIKSTNAIKMELETFYNAIKYDKTPVVTIIDGYNALNLAFRILEKIKI